MAKPGRCTEEATDTASSMTPSLHSTPFTQPQLGFEAMLKAFVLQLPGNIEVQARSLL